MKKNYYLRGNRWSKKMSKETGRFRFTLVTNLPLVSVFLIKENGTVSRGVALCSDHDNPDKYIGRWLAHINAVEARDSKKSTKKILRDEAINVLGRISTLSIQFTYRSEYNPILSQYEKELLDATDEDRLDTITKDTMKLAKADPLGDVKTAMKMMDKTGISL